MKPESALLALVLIALAACGAGQPLSNGPLPTQEFEAPADAAPSATFRGRLVLRPDPANSHLQAFRDDYDAALTPEWDVIHLPPVELDFVQAADTVIPAQRGALPAEHLYWEWIFEPGKAWDDPAKPGWTTVSMPFSLQERNQNCTHHGLLKFDFRADGAISAATYQIGSETCMYFKADLWGELRAEYRPGEVPHAERLIDAHQGLLAARLPVRSFSELAARQPNIDIAGFVPPVPEHVTVYGLVLDGIHYLGGCETRHGPHPYCLWLDLPSYSTAKSIFAGLVFIRLEKAYPGFADTEVTELVPECRLPDGRWEGVTMRHLLNMTTGNFNDTGHEADEGAANVGDFFLPETHAEKLAFSCTAFPRRAAPGEQFVYHTFDTYLLGTAMTTFLRRHRGAQADPFRDILAGELLAPLELSPVARLSRRTNDSADQPFTGYGLTWTPDDIARIGQWLNRPAGDEDSRLSGTEFDKALFRATGPVHRLEGARGEAYVNGFWGYDISNRIGCRNERWIPFMSGFGGVVVALIPNQSVYYYFSDDDRYRWADAAASSHHIKEYCE